MNLRIAEIPAAFSKNRGTRSEYSSRIRDNCSLDVVRHAAQNLMPSPKSNPTTFRFQPEVRSALAVIAERQGRSMANMLEWLIKKHCEPKKLGWPPDDVTPTGSKTRLTLSQRERSQQAIRGGG